MITGNRIITEDAHGEYVTVSIHANEPCRIEIVHPEGSVMYIYKGVESDPDQEPDGCFDFAGMTPEENHNFVIP